MTSSLPARVSRSRAVTDYLRRKSITRRGTSEAKASHAFTGRSGASDGRAATWQVNALAWTMVGLAAVGVVSLLVIIVLLALGQTGADDVANLAETTSDLVETTSDLGERLDQLADSLEQKDEAPAEPEIDLTDAEIKTILGIVVVVISLAIGYAAAGGAGLLLALLCWALVAGVVTGAI